MDALRAVDAMPLTKIEFERIHNDEREVDSIIKLGESNARKKDVDPLYEFQKKNRSNVLHAFEKPRCNYP